MAQQLDPMTDPSERSPQEVFDEHLRLSQEHEFEQDIGRNFAEDCVVLTDRGVFRGHDGLKELAAMLEDELPGARYEYRTRLVEGHMAFLGWAAHGETARVEDGADSFWIEGGKVVAQTIHYTVKADGAAP